MLDPPLKTIKKLSAVLEAHWITLWPGTFLFGSEIHVLFVIPLIY